MRASYTVKIKLAAVNKVKECGNVSQVSRELDINESTIRYWVKQEQALKDANPDARITAPRRTAKYPALENQVCAYIDDLRKKGLSVSRGMIQDQALIVKRDLGIDDNFKASKGWCTRFMRRNNYSIRRPTKIAQKLPHHFVDKICKFQRFVIRRRGAVNYELRHIANMDETPLCMDMVSGSTVSKKGKKTVLMKSTGHEKSRYTVVLAVTADGNKLPPMIIYRRKTKPPGNFPSGVVIHWNAKGWMDEEACNIWIQKVW